MLLLILSIKYCSGGDWGGGGVKRSTQKYTETDQSETVRSLSLWVFRSASLLQRKVPAKLKILIIIITIIITTINLHALQYALTMKTCLNIILFFSKVYQPCLFSFSFVFLIVCQACHSRSVCLLWSLTPFIHHQHVSAYYIHLSLFVCVCLLPFPHPTCPLCVLCHSGISLCCFKNLS